MRHFYQNLMPDFKPQSCRLDKRNLQAEQTCQIVALACEQPKERPISHWTGREIADEVMRRGIVTQISPRHASRLLKKGTSNPISSATG